MQRSHILCDMLLQAIEFQHFLVQIIRIDASVPIPPRSAIVSSIRYVSRATILDAIPLPFRSTTFRRLTVLHVGDSEDTSPRWALESTSHLIYKYKYISSTKIYKYKYSSSLDSIDPLRGILTGNIFFFPNCIPFLPNNLEEDVLPIDIK